MSQSNIKWFADFSSTLITYTRNDDDGQWSNLTFETANRCRIKGRATTLKRDPHMESAALCIDVYKCSGCCIPRCEPILFSVCG